MRTSRSSEKKPRDSLDSGGSFRVISLLFRMSALTAARAAVLSRVAVRLPVRLLVLGLLVLVLPCGGSVI